MKWFAFILGFFSLQVFSKEANETRELIGHLGGRSALMTLYILNQPDGSARLTGDYLVLPTLQQRFIEGERSKQLGVTFLKESSSPILYGRSASATLQGTWNGGVFRGSRYGPGGQQRERVEFSETFPPMVGYSAAVRCEASGGPYSSTLAYTVENGRLKGLDWRSKLAPGGQSCTLSGFEQQPFTGGLRFASGRCSVTLRDLGGEYVRVVAEGCAAQCAAQAILEPVLVDRRGGCDLLRNHAR